MTPITLPSFSRSPNSASPSTPPSSTGSSASPVKAFRSRPASPTSPSAIPLYPRETSLPRGLIAGDDGLARLEEHSLDPRQLAPALLTAVRNTSVVILDHTTLASAPPTGCLINTLGPWSAPPAAPRKGQMLAVSVPDSIALDYVIRTEHIYIVPRLHGPRAGQAVLGATVEDAGFSTHTEPASLAHLRRLAAAFLPALADETALPMVDQWAGLRPYTPDNLPILGEIEPPDRGGTKHFVATGHYRNGILLAPATAHVMAELLTGGKPLR